MYTYSLKKLLGKAGRSSNRIIAAFRSHITSRMPKNRWDPTYRYRDTDFSGDSYMINPHELLSYAFKVSPREVAEYIALASFRNYSEYKLYNDKTLNVLHSPVKEINNRLLREVNGKIHFYYEESLEKRKELWE